MKQFIHLILLLVTTVLIACNDNADNMDKTNKSLEKMELTQEEAYLLVKKELTAFSLDSIDIYTYAQPIIANSNVETLIHSISSPDTPSWLFFVDEMPKQNWGHPCQYVFVDANSHVSIVKDNIFGKKPSLDDMVMINESVISKEYNPSYVTPAKSCSNSRSARTNNLYAVIINGGGGIQSNHIRYWNDCSSIYKTLIDKYNYDSSKVFVLMSDGTNPAVDTSSGTSSPVDLDGDGITDVDYSATEANVRNVFNQLAFQLTEEDYLFIYTIDHGGLDQLKNESFLVLWNEELLYASDFTNMVKSIKSKATHIVMGQCNSGGFIDYFNGLPNICISTACKKNESSYAMLSLPYDEYVYYWTESHYRTTADMDGNSYINANESHQYATQMDSYKKMETPQHYGGGLLSRRLTLTGIVPQEYSNYVDGYCMINNELKYSFYAGEPDHEPEFGIASGDKIDIIITEPDINYNGSFTWSVLEGQNYLVGFMGNDKRAHLEIRPQSTVGQSIRIKVETSIPIDNYGIAQYLNFYITSGYRIAMMSKDTLYIGKKASATLTYNELPVSAKTFKYQIIDKTNTTLMNGSWPINQSLELNVAALDHGTYTVVIFENNETKAQLNITL